MYRFLSIGIVAFAFTISTASAQDKAGFSDLLAGGDLTKHWNTKGNWKLDKDGVGSLEPRPGEKGWQRYDAYLWSKIQVTDFEVDFEYKVDKGGNSGFYLRVGDLKEPVKNGIEVQIADARPADAKLNDHDSGGIIPGVPPTKRMAKPMGEWNHFNIVNKGDKLTVKLNGVVVNEVDLTMKPLNSRPKTGYIGFQDHGLPLWLRNIKLRELK